jgi:uncharacterized protein
MVLRLLLLVAFGYVIYTLFKRAMKPGRDAPAPAPHELMVTCAHCGVHLPQSDSVSQGAQYYCGDDHRVAGPR